MKSTTREDYENRLIKVIEYIQYHLDDELAIEELAKLASFSPFHFHRVFAGMLGESLADFRRRLRLERAAGHLRFDQYSITELALEAGYENTESFSRAFKKQYGLLPSTFRAQKKQEYKIKYFKNTGEIKMKVEIKKMNERRVLAVRHVGPYQNCGVAWEKLCQFACKNNLYTQETQFLGMCYDDPDVTDPQKVRYDACLTLDHDLEKLDEGLRMTTIPEASYATTIHKGPLDNLKATYANFCGLWASQNRVEFTNAFSIEIYLNDPSKTKPEDLLVEIQMPIKE